MRRFVFLAAAAAFASAAGGAIARADSTLPGTPTAAEAPFVSQAAADLPKLYPNVQAAIDAGYFRFTDEDDTGAISYANLVWTSTDADHPSELWYDASGRLLGADYTVPLTDARPQLFGVDPSRWIARHAHVHYGLAGPNDGTIYGATGGAKFTSAGGSIAAPTAGQLVSAGVVKTVTDVRFVFPFPAIWDLEVWTLPNPNGAFAEMNPNVQPAHSPPPMKM